MVKKILVRLGALLVFLAFFSPAPAADYYFKVNDLKAELTVKKDSSVDIRYAITFTPEAGSHPIDIVDIGMPNEQYDKSSARAWINGQELTVIKDSEYVHPGVEIHLGAKQIIPGSTARLEFQIKVGQMIYLDSDDSAFAALQFKSTWFDGKYVSGNTRQLEIKINLPAGTSPEQVKYHTFGRGDYRPSESFFRDNRVSYVWRWIEQPATVPYGVGASFPKNLVASVYSPPRKSILKALLAAFFAFFAFVFTLSPFLIVVLIIIIVFRSSGKRMKQYLPPKVGIESGGIKRGLTPPEAALLQELPLPKVLLLIIFGLLKKEMLSIKEIADKEFRFTCQKKEGLEPLEYEKEFITAIDPEGRLSKWALRLLFTNMIKSLQTKMAGFSRRETNMYYQSIMNKAWDQVKNAPKEKLPAELADSLEWLAMDNEYESKLSPYIDDKLFLPGHGYYWYQHFPQGAAASAGAATPGKSYGQTVSGAASRFVQSMEVFSAALVGNTNVFTSEITKVTNPPPVQYSSGSRGGSTGGHSSGGHSSCACACACAGCACACAGGGR
jgi:hypothetical protein